MTPSSVTEYSTVVTGRGCSQQNVHIKTWVECEQDCSYRTFSVFMIMLSLSHLSPSLSLPSFLPPPPSVCVCEFRTKEDENKSDLKEQESQNEEQSVN